MRVREAAACQLRLDRSEWRMVLLNKSEKVRFTSHQKHRDRQRISQNSLDKQEMAHVCEYYIRLLNCGKKQHKERVMCLVGEPNSGETNLFTPITRFIPTRYIAMISKQKAFNKSLVDENTQIIFLDEAYAKLMDPDDWKY